jgi:tetratricopeptide (TPR) repeat protein
MSESQLRFISEAAMNDHEYWNEIGNLYFMQGAYEAAVNAYLRSIQLDEKFGKPYSNLASAFVHAGKYEQAIKLYRRSIEFLSDAKDKVITWNRLGALYRQVRDYQNAVAAYQQADILDSRRGGAKTWTAGEPNLPLTVSAPSVDLDLILNGSRSKEKSGAENPGGAAVKTHQRLDDGFVPLDLEKIQRELELKSQACAAPASVEENQAAQIDESLAEYGIGGEESMPVENEITGEKNRAEEPNHADEKAEFEVVKYSHTEYPLPELTIEESDSLKQEIAKYKAETINNPRNVIAWEKLGEACKSAGMYKDAIQAFKTAIANNPSKPSYYYRLGLVYAAERRESEAVPAFEKVLELNPGHVLAHASLGSHYRKLGMLEQAQTHLDKALNTNFENENIYNRACLQAICGNSDRAIELLEVALQTKQTYIQWIRTDPDLDSLHSDERFIALITPHPIVQNTTAGAF